MLYSGLKRHMGISCKRIYKDKKKFLNYYTNLRNDMMLKYGALDRDKFVL
jgi:hypothetical protein